MVISMNASVFDLLLLYHLGYGKGGSLRRDKGDNMRIPMQVSLSSKASI